MPRDDRVSAESSHDERANALTERHLARTDLQAIVQGAFMEELLGLPRVVVELDRIDERVDELASRPASDISDEAISEERLRLAGQLVSDLHLPWPWISEQIRIGLWWRSQLVDAERRRAARLDEPVSIERIPGWPPKWTGDRRVLAVGGGPWALVNFELAPRFVMRRGDSLEALQRRWREIAGQVESVFRSSMFSTLAEDGPPGGAARDDVEAYERYSRWAAQHLIGRESYRQIAASDLADESPGSRDARERWREVKRGVRKALAILDSI